MVWRIILPGKSSIAFIIIDFTSFKSSQRYTFNISLNLKTPPTVVLNNQKKLLFQDDLRKAKWPPISLTSGDHPVNTAPFHI